MAYKGYRKPFITQGDNGAKAGKSYVSSVDVTTLGSTDSDLQTVATSSGFAVTHNVTSRKATPNTVATTDSDGNKGTVKTLEILEALPGWYMKGRSTGVNGGSIAQTFQDSETDNVGAAFGTSSAMSLDSDTGVYTLTFAGVDSDIAAGDYIYAIQDQGITLEAFVVQPTSITGNNTITVKAVGGAWKGFDGTAVFRYSSSVSGSGSIHVGQKINTAGAIVDAANDSDTWNINY